MTDRLLAEARDWSTPPAPELAVSELLAIGERREAQVGRFLEAVAAPLDEEERGAVEQITVAAPVLPGSGHRRARRSGHGLRDGPRD